MADEPGQEPTPDAGQEPTPPPTPPDPSKEPDSKGDAEAFSREYVEQLRREAAANRKKAADLEKWKAEQEAAQLSDSERKDKELAEAKAEAARLTAERHTLMIQHAVEREAAKLGFADPDDAPRFLDLAAVQTDEQGQPQNVKRLLEDVLKAKPYLKGAASPAGVPATPKPANGDLTEAERARLAVPVKSIW